VAADTAADSDLIHGLFRLLGYQFSPAGPTCSGLADLTGGHNWLFALRWGAAGR
jgi:hypothetical protein